MWEHCGIIYSAAISNRIQWFDVNSPESLYTAFIETGFIPNELLIVNNRMFATHWGALGSAKLCEVLCVDILCNTTTTTSSTSSTTTTTTTCFIEGQYGELYFRGLVNGDPNYLFTSSESDMCEAYINHICNGADLYGAYPAVSGYYGPGDYWRLGDVVYNTATCDLVTPGWYILKIDSDPYTPIYIGDAGSTIEEYPNCGECSTTTTTSSSSTTTTTTTNCYELVGCGLYDIYNSTDEFKQVNWKYCYEESWRGVITLPPYSTYSAPDCRAFEAEGCGLIFTLAEECIPPTTTTTTSSSSTTTTTTTIDCSVEGYIMCDYCDCNDDEILISNDETYGIANTYGTYCGLSDEKYNSQIFTLPVNAYVKRVGVLGWNNIGNPDVTIQGLLLNKKSPDYGGRPGCTTVTPAPYPGFNVELSINTIRFTGTPPATPEWYYFCFDDVYLEAGQWAFAMIFTDQTINDESNYVQFCTGGDDYAGGNYAYKISPEINNPYGIPEVLIDLSCKICYEEVTTTTTSTTHCEMPSGWTETGTLISNGDFEGNFGVDFTSNLDDACEAWGNFTCHGGSLYGGTDVNGKWWGPHDNFRVGDNVYIKDTCQLVDSGYYILNSIDHYYKVVQIDNGNITTYWNCGNCTTTTSTTPPEGYEYIVTPFWGCDNPNWEAIKCEICQYLEPPVRIYNRYPLTIGKYYIAGWYSTPEEPLIDRIDSFVGYCTNPTTFILDSEKLDSCQDFECPTTTTTTIP